MAISFKASIKKKNAHTVICYINLKFITNIVKCIILMMKIYINSLFLPVFRTVEMVMHNLNRLFD